MASRNAVVVEDLHKSYGPGRQALAGLWLTMAPGEIYGLLGPNGAGKSTALGTITTTVRPSRGAVEVAGFDTRRQPGQVRRSIGVVFQESVLDNEFTGWENLMLHARLWRMGRADARRRITHLLELIGLEHRADDNVRTYSGGMRRRLEIARALLARPRVLVLDEPTVGLDPAIRAAIWQLIQQLRREEDVTILLSTHYLEEAEEVCDRVGILDRGHLIAEGPSQDLIDELGEELLELRVAVDPARAAGALAATGLGARVPMIRGDVVTLPMRAGPAAQGARQRAIALASDGLGIVATTIRRPTLSDVYAHLTDPDQ